MNFTKFVSICQLLAACLIAQTASAQTGPGGVDAIGTSTNLKLWLSGNRGVYINAGTTLATSNGQSVQQWNDFSGNSLHATNAGSSKPTYNTSSLLNGNPVLNFVGQTLTAGLDISPGTNANITVIAVASHATASASPNSKLWGHDNGGYDRCVGFDTRATVPFTYFSANSGNEVVNYATPTANQYFITTANYTSSTFSGWFNGNSAVSAASVSNGSGATSLSIGSITPTAEFWNGPIAEFIVFNKSLNAAERIIAENYLAAKYGLTLGANDLYTMDNVSNGNYDNDMAGIGQSGAGANVTAAKGTGIVTVGNPGGLATGEYFMFGNDKAAMTATATDVPAGYSSRMLRVWRPSETGDVGTTDISFDLTGLYNTPASASNIFLVIDRNNDGSFADETTGGGGIISTPSQAGTTFTFSGVNINDGQRFTLLYTNLIPLPLVLTGITANARGTENFVSWKTANEHNVASFSIEKSSDGISFVAAGAIPAQNNAAGGQYGFTDSQPFATTYYRLRMIDLDASYQYSAVVKVSGQTLRNDVVIAPNPASGIANISGLPGTASTIQLSDVTGRLLEQLQTDHTSCTLQVSRYPAGVYYIHIDTGNSRFARKLIKN